jgi:hypothetical protein
LPLKAITWLTVAVASAVIAAAVFACAMSRQEKFRLDSVLWVYAGTFTAIAVAWGLVEILVSDGYGTGDIF